MGNDKEVIVPKEVVVIGEGAFEGNKTLERITLGENVRYIKSRAFSECRTFQKEREQTFHYRNTNRH